MEFIDRLSAPLPPSPVVESRGVPWAPLIKPLAECTVMLLNSAGVRPKDEPAFQPSNDLTFRLIPADAAAADLAPSHPAPVRRPGEADPNVVFPLERLRELQAEGLFRAVAPYHVSMHGPIRKYREVHYEMGPAIAEQVRAAGADLLVLIPL
jgi:D-proline reductase (dithiol) PrdB